MNIIRIHSEEEIDSWYPLICTTYQKYFNITLPIEEFHRSFYLWKEREKSFSCFILNNETDCFLMNLFRESLFNNEYKYVPDYYGSVLFYGTNAWEQSQLLTKFRSYLKGIEHIPIPYFKNELFQDLLKNVKNNYHSHLFGKKSTEYSIDFSIEEDINLRLLTILYCYGAKRKHYLSSLGETWVEPELYDILFKIKMMFLSSITNGVSFYKINGKDKGFLTWYIVNNIGYLDEILIEDVEKRLSPYPILTLKTANYLFSEYNVSKIMLGFCSNMKLTDYKKRLTNNTFQVTFNKSCFNSIEEFFDTFKGKL